MTILQIYVAPHSVLKKVADPVDKVTDELRGFMKDMLETMYENDGIGLAAPQVGVSKRIMIIDVKQKHGMENPQDRRGEPIFFVNPEITWTSEESNLYQEGCLSLPDQYADVERPKQVKVKYMDYDGKVCELDADGLLATAIQHEIDHLNGILFVDHLSKLKKDMVLKKLKKYVRANKEELEETHVTL